MTRLDEHAVQRDVLLAWEYAHIHDDWVNPLKDALADVSAEEAAWSLNADARCICGIVLHMTAWTSDVVQWIQTGILRKPTDDWPSTPKRLDEAAWQDAQQQLWNTLTLLREQLAGMPPKLLLDSADKNGSLLLHLLGRFIHNAYHIGQITKIREFYAARGVPA